VSAPPRDFVGSGFYFLVTTGAEVFLMTGSAIIPAPRCLNGMGFHPPQVVVICGLVCLVALLAALLGVADLAGACVFGVSSTVAANPVSLVGIRLFVLALAVVAAIAGRCRGVSPIPPLNHLIPFHDVHDFDVPIKHLSVTFLAPSIQVFRMSKDTAHRSDRRGHRLGESIHFSHRVTEATRL